MKLTIFIYDLMQVPEPTTQTLFVLSSDGEHNDGTSQSNRKMGDLAVCVSVT